MFRQSNIWARSSVGRALRSQRRGRGFESLRVHQKSLKSKDFRDFALIIALFTKSVSSSPPVVASNANTLDAVGATPTESTLSGVFDLKISASKTIDASKRLARFEPARSLISAGALFEHGGCPWQIQKGH